MDILKLTNSKTRSALLRLYFAHPEKRHYLRELERAIDFPASNIRRELLDLVKYGLFLKERDGDNIYYFLNKDFPIYNEIKSIVFKTIGIEGELRKQLKKIKGILAAFIFGSFASGDENKNSDIDLYLIVEENFKDKDLLRIIIKLEKLFDREINYHYMDLSEFKEKKKTNSFINNILEKKKIILINHEELH